MTHTIFCGRKSQQLAFHMAVKVRAQKTADFGALWDPGVLLVVVFSKLRCHIDSAKHSIRPSLDEPLCAYV